MTGSIDRNRVVRVLVAATVNPGEQGATMVRQGVTWVEATDEEIVLGGAKTLTVRGDLTNEEIVRRVGAWLDSQDEVDALVGWVEEEKDGIVFRFAVAHVAAPEGVTS